MKLIESKAEVLIQEGGLQGIYQMIELAGRTCYKSEDKITDSSSVDFVKRMTRSGHTAMLEHGTVYLKSSTKQWPQLSMSWYALNPYSRMVLKAIDQEDGSVDTVLHITTNLRVLVENNRLDDLQFLCEPTEYHEKRISMRFTTDRGVSHELVRHRVFSFAQESTRYCNYSKDKFGNEVSFIIPSWCPSLVEGVLEYSPFEITQDEVLFLDCLQQYENNYFRLLTMQHTPQEARQVLPNALKTEIVMTGFVSDWKHFFDLRLLGTTGKPHPDMLLLANKAKHILEENGLWGLIYV